MRRRSANEQTRVVDDEVPLVFAEQLVDGGTVVRRRLAVRDVSVTTVLLARATLPGCTARVQDALLKLSGRREPEVVPAARGRTTRC
jgi:hypothetical protein